ncbi:MAG: hypothetical protein ABJI96_17600 [Paracoccaceae bacterium]
MVDAIAPYLSHDNEVIRCAALRAYAAWAPPERAREALLEKFLDPDPDIRADAIERLVGLATAKDATALRTSLEGDPVRESKMAAIEALSALRDETSIPILRKLVHSRSEDSVAWEDDGGDWDEWLDIQLAAIKALGHMQVADAIEDLLTARQDEFGQNIDGVVFDALREMGAPGIEILLHIKEDEGTRAARRATSVLAKADPEALAPFVDQLLASDDADIRKLAISILATDDLRVVALAHHDPSVMVQCEALRQIAHSLPAEIETALHSRHEAVQAEAVVLLDRAISPDLHEALVDNLFSWLRHAGPRLTTAAARALPRFAPNRCEAPLLDAIADTKVHLEARIAAVTALADKSPPVATEYLSAKLDNQTRQIRTAAFAAIALRAKNGDETAIDTVVAAIRGELVSVKPGMVNRDEADLHDATMPKTEAGPPSIRITRDGEIVEGEDEATGSTLYEILAATREPDDQANAAEDTPEEAPAMRRKRQPIEGPDDFAESFQADAIRICNDTGDARVEEVLLTSAIDGPDQIRQEAWTALSKWPKDYRFSTALREAALVAMTGADPIIQSAAFSILAQGDMPPEALRLGLESEDALLRADAVTHLPASSATDFVNDPSAVVRRRSVDQLLEDADSGLLVSAVRQLSATEWTDTLCDLFYRSEVARAEGLRHLAKASEPKQVLILLEGFAGSGRA